MSQTATCDKCGKTYGIGDSPFCRDNHESGGRFGHGAFTPHVDTEIYKEPVHFGNWGEKLKFMDRHGIEPRQFRENHFDGKIYSR